MNDIPQPARFEQIRRKLLHPFWFRWYLLRHLPMGFLSGMRIRKLNEQGCMVGLTYSWINKNPFRSTFWAVMGMAAEMSSGALLLAYTAGQVPRVAFILTGSTAEFMAKAKGQMYFECMEGEAIRSKVLLAMQNHEKHPLLLRVSCSDASGQELARFTFTWMLQQRVTS